MMISRLLCGIVLLLKRHKKIVFGIFLFFLAVHFLGLATVKIYQNWDDDPDRGAAAVRDGAFGESYSTPVYLDQGWKEADSLWFYNTTQGSGLLPYDFFLVLEQADSESLFRSDGNIDRYRYLPQKKTFFNPDALPVGFVKETYQGKDYVGYTCAACHTGQINYGGKAIRIDGGPAMADMVGFLRSLEAALAAAGKGEKWKRFVGNVLARDNDYSAEEEIAGDLGKWSDAIFLYNTVNQSTYGPGKRVVEYGYGRLDAFGRIYNRVLQHVINRDQVAEILAYAESDTGETLLTDRQIDNVLAGIDNERVILRDADFALIVKRLEMDKPDYPELGWTDFLRVRDMVFNSPNAPVSYPFLWDIAQSDYVQWNGIANNALAGPLGRNAGEVIGVFGILDWQVDERFLTRLTGFSLSAWLTGQRKKRKQIYFKSSIDLTNLQRLEGHLRRLKSPRWPFCKDRDGKYYIPKNENPRSAVDTRDCREDDTRFDETAVDRGRKIYTKLCQSCHEVIDREAADRIVVANMNGLERIGTDPAMARNSVDYSGKSGNFKHTYQAVGVGNLIVEDTAPAATILTAATKGVIATRDADKGVFRRGYEWLYTLVMSIAENDIAPSIKRGNYEPDTTANPFASLLAYKARSLNGIWATAPYLHNGSVPSLYHLLLPLKCKDESVIEEYRPASFVVGSREFDPKRVGFKSDGYDGFKFRTDMRGNRNTGHVYGACRLTGSARWDLLEYLKTL